MPKATAIWLIDNTSLTFKQISDFCGLHPLEVQGIADGEVSQGIKGVNPITHGQLTKEDIKKCEQDSNEHLSLSHSAIKLMNEQKVNNKKGKYIPIARRQDKPNAIAWLIQNYKELSDGQISKLIGSTKNTIELIKTKTHWNYNNIRPKDPVLLGLCTQKDLDTLYEKILKNKEKEKANK
ncbi:MAG: hypothetical protein ACI8ZF_000358 [Candidatus Midichloriaceae bacterium]|jgi:hypothetical protein